MTDIHVIEAKPIVKPFYVYVHKYASGPKEGQVFYVGKGKGVRAFSCSGRNTYWNRIINKYGHTVLIVTRFEREQCAFSFERSLIKFYSRENLCNLTDGGEGPSGMIHTQEWKNETSIRLSGRKVNDDTRRKISEIKKGIQVKSFEDIRIFHTVTNSDGETFKSINSAARAMSYNTGLSNRPANIYRCLTGFSKSAYGVSWGYGVNTPPRLGGNNRKIINITTGKIFNGVKDASKSILSKSGNTVSSSLISKALRSEKKMAYGFKWSYLDEVR